MIKAAFLLELFHFYLSNVKQELIDVCKRYKH